jgi:hypothetical protein
MEDRVFKFFENKYARWGLIGGSSFIFVAILTGFVAKAYIEKTKREAEIEALKEAEREYEDKFRTGMTRIYQNLKLGHFLAAYKNLETLPEPRRSNPLKVEEYLEVLNRVGTGLIQNQLLKEAESVFLTIRNFEGQLTKANEALGKIESKRRIENAKFFFAQGEQLMGQKRYREANREFDKAQLELRSVEILQYDNASEQWEHLKPKLLEARFYTLIDDAEGFLKKAESALKDKKFKQSDQYISQAAIRVGRAAYFRAQSPEVFALRKRISDLDGELGYALPNDVPIWNAYSVADQQKQEHFFTLEGYELASSLDKEGQMKIGLQYKMNLDSKYFVIRYRIFFYNGRDIFNGHYLVPEAGSKVALDAVKSIIYLQEIPEKYRTAQIKRIEVKIFDENGKVVSRVTRAFRKSSV